MDKLFWLCSESCPIDKKGYFSLSEYDARKSGQQKKMSALSQRNYEIVKLSLENQLFQERWRTKIKLLKKLQRLRKQKTSGSLQEL